MGISVRTVGVRGRTRTRGDGRSTRGAARLLLAALGALTLTLGLYGTSSASTSKSTAATPAHIGVFIVIASSDWNEQIPIATKQVLAKYPPGTYTVYNATYNSATQANQMRDALVSKKFNVWLVNSDDGSVTAPIMEQAIKAGIKVVCVSTVCGKVFTSNAIQVPGEVAFVGSGGYGLNGQYIAEATMEACIKHNGSLSKPCNVFYIPGTRGEPYETARTNGFDSVISKYKTIHVVAKATGTYSSAKSLTATQNALTAHPTIQVIASASDQMTLGATKAVAAAGDSGKITLVGNGAGKLAVSAIESGKWFASVTTLPHSIGYESALLGVEALRGAHIVDKYVDVLAGQPKWIDKQNAAHFAPQWTT